MPTFIQLPVIVDRKTVTQCINLDTVAAIRPHAQDPSKTILDFAFSIDRSPASITVDKQYGIITGLLSLKDLIII